ncbi:MAG: hypothetical protein H8M99_07680 [Gloeobacteraceae cyanobacterium ES-bin-144]|nr:hypothetical protein [Verrucomicrobiales bacterium]
MIGVRWLTSPLAGTAGVLVGLCLVAIPLRKLTSAEPVTLVKTEVKKSSSSEIPAVLRLKLLVPAKHVIIKTADEKILLDARDLAAGESEHDAVIPFTSENLTLILKADFGGSQAETAVFITLLPDGYDEQTRYTTGNGLLEDSLTYEWHTH